MSRVQLALNVTDLDAAIAFYRQLFATEPAKVRPGYANFAIVDPPLKLVLIEGRSSGGTLNHLGIEVASAEEVGAAHHRLANAGLATAVEDQVACCYAVQDKVWVDGPDAEPWEVYTVLADVEMPAGQLRRVDVDAETCGPGACRAASPAAAAAECCDQPAAVSAAAPYAVVAATPGVVASAAAGADLAAAPAFVASAGCDLPVGA